MQTQAMLDMMAAIRRKAGSHPDHVFTTTISLAGLDGFSGRNASSAAAFKPPSSARSIWRSAGVPAACSLRLKASLLLNGNLHDDL
jgi:enamine deaminase RidA (YjgF/YER057c/UK114 family)